MPPQQSVLQVALVPGALPESAPPEGALPIIYADRVVGWATPTIARVEDAEAVAAFRAMDVPLGWRVRAVLEPVPPPAQPLVFGTPGVHSAGEAVSTPAALVSKPAALAAVLDGGELAARVADDFARQEYGRLEMDDGRVVERGVTLIDGRRVDDAGELNRLRRDITRMGLQYELLNGDPTAEMSKAALANAIDRSAT